MNDLHTFNMSGGTIENCSAPVNGGGIIAAGGAVANITGGTITGCKMTSGNDGGVYLDDGTLTLGGTVQITENHKVTGESVTDNNLYLPSGRTITIGDGITGKPVPTIGMSVGITTAGTPIEGSPISLITASDTGRYAQYFR